MAKDKGTKCKATTKAGKPCPCMGPNGPMGFGRHANGCACVRCVKAHKPKAVTQGSTDDSAAQDALKGPARRMLAAFDLLDRRAQKRNVKGTPALADVVKAAEARVARLKAIAEGTAATDGLTWL